MIINNPDGSNSGMKDFLPPVPEKQRSAEALPPPPPYSPPAGPSRPPQHPAGGPPTPTGPVSVFRPFNPQTVNHFELFSKHDAISGTFTIDPSLPSPMVNLSKNLRRKPDSVWGKTKGRKAKRFHELNASFQSQHGSISLNLAVAGPQQGNMSPFPGDKTQTRVYTATRHGRINLSVTEVHQSRSLDLHVESRHGRINILLPPTFNGPLVVDARTLGSVQFLPHFAARTRTIRATDRETVVLVASPLSSQQQPPQLPNGVQAKNLSELAGAGADRCLVRTRHGRISIGVCGLDTIEEPVQVANVFEKLGRFFETQGRALGQYVETQAKNIERWAQNPGFEQAQRQNCPLQRKDGPLASPGLPGRYPSERYEAPKPAGGPPGERL